MVLRLRFIEDASGDAPPPPSFGEDPTVVVIPLRLGLGGEERRGRGFGKNLAKLVREFELIMVPLFNLLWDHFGALLFNLFKIRGLL